MANREVIIEELRLKIEEISQFIDYKFWGDSVNEPIFQNRFESTNRLLDKLNNKKVLLSLVDFIPWAISEDTSDAEYDQAFSNWLMKAKLRLESIIHELNKFWIDNIDKKKAPQLIINNTNNNSQNVSINIEHVLKNKLTGEQYNEFEKIRNEWNKDKILKFFNDLGIGVLSWIISSLVMWE